MDIICAQCSEPWDIYELQLTQKNRMARGEGCPTCDWGRICWKCRGTGWFDGTTLSIRDPEGTVDREYTRHDVTMILSDTSIPDREDYEPKYRDGVYNMKCTRCHGDGKPRAYCDRGGMTQGEISSFIYNETGDLDGAITMAEDIF